jgi:hypothetical protein
MEAAKTFGSAAPPFPEPRLNEALMSLQKYVQKEEPLGAPVSFILARNVSLVRQVLYHFSVPEGEVVDRMNAMGIGEIWRAIVEIAAPPQITLAAWSLAIRGTRTLCMRIVLTGYTQPVLVGRNVSCKMIFLCMCTAPAILQGRVECSAINPTPE